MGRQTHGISGAGRLALREVTIHELDPLRDPRWSRFLGGQPMASIFHSPGWLKALEATYGYEASVLTTSEPGAELTNGLLFSRVRSWLTGKRLVSVPFSDYCDLLGAGNDRMVLRDGLGRLARAEGYGYAEIRPVSPVPDGGSFEVSQRFHHHRIDLRPGANEVFRRFHKDCIQRKINRANREGLEVRQGTGAGLLGIFYRLLILTRRRHGYPPPPLAWFRNVTSFLRDSGVLIRLAVKGETPVAAVLTACHGRTIHYKYGVSDAALHHLGGMAFLFWRTIQDAIAAGLDTLDLGRTDLDNPGLREFKERLGAQSSELAYQRTTGAAPALNHGWKARVIRAACERMPDRGLSMLGSFLYPHVA